MKEVTKKNKYYFSDGTHWLPGIITAPERAEFTLRARLTQ